MLTLSAPVGATLGNKPADVLTVQKQLNLLLACLAGYQPLREDGRIGPKSIAAIRTFQTAIGVSKVDGMVQPGSQMLKSLGQRSLRLPKPHAACELALQDRVRSQIIYRLSIIVRKVWGAKAATRPYVSDWNYTGIAVHHAGNSHSCAADARGQMQDIQQTETGKGFVDVGYHYGISCAGAIYEGRDIRYKGEHVLNQNTGLIGIVLLADFTKRGEGAKFGKNETMIGRLRDRMDFSNEDTLAAQQLSALGSLITTLQDFFDLTRLGGHREFGAALGDERSCPGDLVIAQLDGLRKQHGLIAP